MASIRSLPIIRKLPGWLRTRTPTVLQMEAVECGAAALGIILAYYGRWVPLSELRRECGVSRDGSQASYLLAAGRQYGFEARAFSIDLEDLPDLPCPYIVFWNFNHFLVVEGIGKERVYLNDPATGPRSVSIEEFDEAYTGVVLYFEPSDSFVKGGRKPSALRALYRRLEGSLGALAYCILLGFMLVLPSLAIPVFSQVFVDNVLIQGLNDWLRPLILGLILTLIGALLYFVFNRSGLWLIVLAILSASPAIVCSALFVATALDLMEIVASVFRTRVAGIWRNR